MLIAIEGIDQSGKGTQAERLSDRLRAAGQATRVIAFPQYETAIGNAIAKQIGIEGPRSATALQLLCIADRYTACDEIESARRSEVVICDRYTPSAIAYGLALGVDERWMRRVQLGLPTADLTVLLDIEAGTAGQRKPEARDRYEQDIKLLAQVRGNYLRMARGENWTVIDGHLPAETVSDLLWDLVGRIR